MTPTSNEPRRGEVWRTSLGASRRGELGKNRLAIIVSVDRVIAGVPDEPIVVVPLSSSLPPSMLRPEINDAAEGVERPSRANCGALRGVARSRLLQRVGELAPAKLAEVERALALILGLDGGGPPQTALTPAGCRLSVSKSAGSGN